MSRLVYYLVLVPLSSLPLRVLYLLADVFYIILRTVFKYRKEVAMKNISNAFPEKNEKAVEQIFKENQRHLADLMAEGIKGLSISERQLERMIRLRDSEDARKLKSGEKSAILLGSHCNNWELLILAQAILYPQKAVGVGKPLTKAFMDKKLNARRERFGMNVVNAKNYAATISDYKSKGQTVSILVLADQAPHKTDNAYWAKHFGLDTPFSFGAESMAHKFGFPVYYLRTRRAARGKYVIDVELITDSPSKAPYGSIMDRYVELLEDQISKNPARWLWTHERWKHTPPEDLEQIKAAHRRAFEQRFPKVDT